MKKENRLALLDLGLGQFRIAELRRLRGVLKSKRWVLLNGEVALACRTFG